MDKLNWTTLKEASLTAESYDVDTNDVKQWYLCEHKNVLGPYHFFIGFLGKSEYGYEQWYDQDGWPCANKDEVERLIPIE